MRVVFDINILISALITKGTPSDILYQSWLNSEIQVVMTSAQVAEVKYVLARPRIKQFVHTEETDTIAEHVESVHQSVAIVSPV